MYETGSRRCSSLVHMRAVGQRLMMSILSEGASVKRILIAFCLALSAARAQEARHDHDMGQSSPQPSMAGMNMDEHASSDLPSPHESSGTSWQPASVTGHQWMW